MTQEQRVGWFMVGCWWKKKCKQAGEDKSECLMMKRSFRNHINFKCILSAKNHDDALLIVEFKTTLKLIEYSTVLLYISPASFTVKDIV